MAGVCREVREEVLKDPLKMLENLKALGEDFSAQIFDAKPIISLRQIHAAAVAAYLSFKAGVNISKRLEIEFLLRLAADTQISRALERIGVKPTSREVGFCIFADNRERAIEIGRTVFRVLGGKALTDSELRAEDRVKEALKFYEIEESELENVQADSWLQAALLLILERIATLDVKR
ncbi:MAG: hypothetical protein DRN49_04520 [Thaumarchaeota archaeon]|nr:MAG: hypothetical protein DRN49_04520 [Nitrososphaerota archaeon]